MSDPQAEIQDAGHVPPARAGSYPIRTGNRVRPLVDGRPAFRRICEAVEAARHSVFVTVAFLERDVPMPDGRGSFFDVLEGAAGRGVEVRALFWREPRLHELEPDSTHFPGDAEDRAFLRARSSSFLARWDRHPKSYCHHQKSWLIDAGDAGEVAFVGGINLLRSSSLASPEHPALEIGQDHDVYVEVRGPAATDVHHNFVQRWNGASEASRPDGVWPNAETARDLEFPALLSPAAGDVAVQMTRTVMAGLYRDETAAPGAKPFPIGEGEKSCLEQYLAAIAAAREAIYLEDQAIGSPAIVDALAAALDRGVDVLFLVPGNAHPAFVEARRDPRAAFFFEKLAELARFERFTLAAIAGSRGDGHYDEIYVHAKIMLVDDAWATIGSTNVAERSFHNDTELNASFWHAETVRNFRVELLREHLARDTTTLDARGALRLFHELARGNRKRRALGQRLEGLAYAVDPNEYGT
ncbi:MAG: phosphatidylserine/phosphatidylglycerophosphate/cardiolipin synthase family protein [Myxococcota bacterium]|nr:phosphatidylserine/phosphatidylglycerophosphate/cardiolipin synthase family protein [bacterium]MDP6075696.1 phosphatidylserine/phosphatidylglycerophosphate/cardiolipin synthase family protein [Myxococcota bacterium]MDP6243467.1 phosphatidylserine/phosphatidylglycerophosphate/cardiolipin synthase family protein [Myxococcota bacterium]MDP7075440.1 phosphatidylserine/phosphatidylglycerophosphate/cardiolipin synthase family protein [Myxococcota bacterium]MDP7299603.1 phosphatidylserine/phosphati